MPPAMFKILALVSSLACALTLWGCGGDDTTAGPGPGPAPAPIPTRPDGTNASTVQDVWDNHFAAFAAMNRDQVMWDYDDNSIIMTYNDNCFNGDSGASRRGYREFKGRAAIRGFFDTLFNQLGNDVANVNCIGPSGLGGTCTPASPGAPVVHEGSPDIEDANVFLTWRTANITNIIEQATDTFSFRKVGSEYFIDLQTIVTTEAATATDTSDCPVGTQRPVNPDGATEPIYAAWDNHYTAFGTKNITMMMLDYDANSRIQVFDNREKIMTTYEGTGRIQTFFEALFDQITNGRTNATDPTTEGVGVGLLEVDPAFNSVFLVWQSNSHPQATDTFIFAGAKIRQQTIVVTTAADVSPVTPSLSAVTAVTAREGSVPSVLPSRTAVMV